MLFLWPNILLASLEKPASNIDPFNNPPRPSLNEGADPSNAKLAHLSTVSIPGPYVEPITVNAQSLNRTIGIDGRATEFSHYKLPAHPGERTW
jgi:hypothetical protein